MEELGEGLIKAVLRFIRLVLIETLCEFVIYWVGRIFLLLVTFGRYPRGKLAQEHEGRIICTGLAVTFTSIILIGIYAQ